MPSLQIKLLLAVALFSVACGKVEGPKVVPFPTALPDASPPPTIGPDASPPLDAVDARLDSDAPADGPREAAAPDVAPRPPDASPTDTPLVSDRAPDTATADGPASPCPGVVPPGYGVECGCAGGGTIQCDGTCTRPDSTCIPAGQSYVLTNLFLGDTRRLDTYNSPMSEAFMASQIGNSGQFWNISALGGGFYRLTNLFLGPSRSLEALADGSRLFMGSTGDVPAQRWRIRGIRTGIFRIQNGLHGDARSLDTRNDGVGDPFMNMTADYAGQLWRITSLP